MTFLKPATFLAASLLMSVAANATEADVNIHKDCSATLPQADGDKTVPSPAGSLSATLDNCNGVIQPPRVGDNELVTTPPSTGGTMPTIRPGQIPQQVPEQESNKSPEPTARQWLWRRAAQ